MQQVDSGVYEKEQASIKMVPEMNDCKKLADFFTLFSNHLRLKVICFLSGRSRAAVTEIVEAVGFSKFNVSQQLKTLRLSGVIEGEKKGRMVFYSIVEPKLIPLFKSIADLSYLNR